MIHPFLLALTVAFYRPAVQHQWAVLLLTSAERIDIDTSSIQSVSRDAHRVWLRWDFDRAATANFGPEFAQYVLERRDFDCASYRTRIIAKRREAGGKAPPAERREPGAEAAGAGESLSARETSWQEPTKGSLLAQVFDAVCRFTKAGA